MLEDRWENARRGAVMGQRVWLALLPCFLVLCGCLPLQIVDPDKESAGNALVPTSPFGTPPAPQPQGHTVAFGPASRETALRVDRVGRDVLAANPQIGLRPLFATIGAPQPELFHQGSKIVHITDSLVAKCQSDAQLAALLCLELGKMVAEREEMASPRMRNPQGQPPMEVPIGNAGQYSSPDLTHLVELAPYDRERQRAGKRLAPPDPVVLAAAYLEKAGFSRTDLDSAAPLLALAEPNCSLEKQISGSAPVPTWTPQK
jgi:hypothetical protein